MSHKLVSSILALLFLVIIQSLNDVFRYLLAGMVIYLAIVMGYNYWYLKSRNFFTFWAWLRPLYFVGALSAAYLVIPETGMRGFFVIFGTIGIFLLELSLLSASEQVVFLETLFSYFAIVVAIFNFNFSLLPGTWLILILSFLATFLITRSSLEYIPQPNLKKNFFSWLVALCILEVSWSLLFLPLHFTILAAVLFNLFYLLWIVVYY